MISLITLLIVSLSIQIILFIPAFILKTDKLTDLAYGLTFILLSFVALQDSSSGVTKTLLFALILIWAVRLGTYLVIRVNQTGKDDRFDSIRHNPLKFLGFWLAQGALAWLILLPTFYYLSATGIETNAFTLLGLAIWLLGISIETSADHQKFTFKSNPKNKDRFISSGIWAYSRHPNYFGEFLLWLGIYVFTFTQIAHPIIALISPIAIFIVLRFVSGVPHLEERYNKKYKHNKSYQTYKKKTPLFFPFNFSK